MPAPDDTLTRVPVCVGIIPPVTQETVRYYLLSNLEGAFIREQGVQFGVVIVQPHVLHDRSQADRLIMQFRTRLFSGHPVVLMAQDAWGTPTYYGRQDIVNFMASVPLGSVPWMRYTLT